jgi:tRNA 2-thiouridine synthesizing protein A
MNDAPQPRPSPAVRIDITGDVCPMTWVKTKLELEEMAAGEVLEVRLREGESHHNVVTNIRDEGHLLLADEADGGDEQIRLILIRHAG